MKTIPISEIVVSPTRQRRTFDAALMQEFQEGIKNRGLLHPIILRRVESSDEFTPDVYTLVAGERRLRAVESLAALSDTITHDGEPVPLGSIPYTLLSDLSPLAAEEAEYEENALREDLNWQDRAAAILRLRTLRAAQATARGTPPPSVADIATEVQGHARGSAHEATRRALVVAEHLGKPAVAAAKTLDEAYKVLKREEAADRATALGESVGRTYSADVHRVLNTDSLDWMKAADAEQFDVILTDPPYGMGADEFGDSGGLAQGAHAYADDAQNFERIAMGLINQSYRITKPQAHLYMFCDLQWFNFLHTQFQAMGWWVFRTPLIWHKPSAMRAPWPENGPQRKYECCLYAVKGKRKVRRMAADLVAFAPDTNLGHAAQKPVALFEDLLSRSVWPGDSVFDPFCGTGVILPAAHTLKCHATAIELDPASYGIAVGRLKTLNAQPELTL